MTTWRWQLFCDQHSGLTEIYLRFVVSITILMARSRYCGAGVGAGAAGWTTTPARARRSSAVSGRFHIVGGRCDWDSPM
jgi:hypothetical protein